MAYYKILTTPGKEEVDVEEVLGEKLKLNTQDTVNIVRQRLRAMVKAGTYPGVKKGQRIDFVVTRDAEAARSPNSSGGTSIRLTEEQRRRLAKIVGRHMMETGEMMSMGDAVVGLIEENDLMRRRIQELEAKLDEEEDEED